MLAGKMTHSCSDYRVEKKRVEEREREREREWKRERESGRGRKNI